MTVKDHARQVSVDVSKVWLAADCSKYTTCSPPHKQGHFAFFHPVCWHAPSTYKNYADETNVLLYKQKANGDLTADISCEAADIATAKKCCRKLNSFAFAVAFISSVCATVHNIEKVEHTCSPVLHESRVNSFASPAALEHNWKSSVSKQFFCFYHKTQLENDWDVWTTGCCIYQALWC